MGAGTPGCLETGEVGNAPASKQPGWNKTPKAKNRESGYGNKIKKPCLPPPPPPSPQGRRGHPHVTTGQPDGWLGWVVVGVYRCTHQCCPPTSRCVSPLVVLCAGPSPAAVTGPSCLPAGGRGGAWDINTGLHPRVGSDLSTDAGGDKGHWEQDQVLAEEGTELSPTPWPGLCRRAGGCGVASRWHLLPSATLSSAGSHSPRPHWHLCTQRVPIPRAGQGEAGVTGSILPSLPAAFIPGQLPPPPPLPARAPRGWQENNSEEDE